MAKLLMLDDDKEALSWMRAALEERGHEVMTFTTARDALSALQNTRPDLIISDVLMPEMDGLAFARLARHDRALPIMFVSIAKKEAEAVLVGAVGYVRKPASPADIRAAVERVLGEGARNNTILIVDDDRDVCDLFAAFLGKRFDVITAHDGRAGLEILRSRRVDLAVVDVHMPVMNGVELVRAVRADPTLEKLPIIVQTNDPAAVESKVWRPLQVAKVMDKTSFVDWVEEQVSAVSE